MTFFFDTALAKVIAGACAIVAIIMSLVQVGLLFASGCASLQQLQIIIESSTDPVIYLFIRVYHRRFTLRYIASNLQIIQHLRHYTEPTFQRYIVRIIFLLPVYSACSFASLMAEDAAIYIVTIRDCYEAWIIYNFMSLCLAYVGGPGAVEVKMQGVVLLPSWSAWTCCLPPLPVNGHFIRVVKQGALQFVILKPLLAALTLVLYATGHYTEGDWSIDSWYLWITVVYNITYTLALYALLLFYMGTHELLAPFRPLLKFVLVKSVIFFTYWQGLAISVMVGAGLIATISDGNNIQNFLISVEMLPAAFCMMFAFPWKEYASGNGVDGNRRGVLAGLAPDAVTHAISFRDVVTDTVHQFAPTYQNYVLYSDGTAKKAVPAGGKKRADGADLLSANEVEMGGIQESEDEVYEDMEEGDHGRRSRYLVDDSEEGRSGGGGRRGGRGEKDDAEARWASIQLSPTG